MNKLLFFAGKTTTKKNRYGGLLPTNWWKYGKNKKKNL